MVQPAPVSLRDIWCDFHFKGWECDFRIPVAILKRTVQLPSLCVPSGAILGPNTFRRKFN